VLYHVGLYVNNHRKCINVSVGVMSQVYTWILTESVSMCQWVFCHRSIREYSQKVYQCVSGCYVTGVYVNTHRKCVNVSVGVMSQVYTWIITESVSMCQWVLCHRSIREYSQKVYQCVSGCYVTGLYVNTHRKCINVSVGVMSQVYTWTMTKV